MSFREKTIEEVKAILLTTLYFGAWFGVLMALKRLVLAEYHIGFRGFSAALLGAVVVAKVVLVMEHVSLGRWVRRQPAIVDVILRTLLYTLGFFLVLLLEKAFEARHEYGSYGRALANIFHHRDMPHIWANTIAVASALLGFCGLAVLRRTLGNEEFTALFLSRPPPNKPVPVQQRARA
jgi:hypothetical protein